MTQHDQRIRLALKELRALQGGEKIATELEDALDKLLPRSGGRIALGFVALPKEPDGKVNTFQTYSFDNDGVLELRAVDDQGNRFTINMTPV